jgi:hypothetical protein
MTETRDGVWSASAHGLKTRKEVREGVVAQGFDATDVDARLDEVDSAMAEDRAFGRQELGSTVVIRTDDGYRIRSIGEYDWWPRHGAVSRERVVVKLRERHAIVLASSGNLSDEERAQSDAWHEDLIEKLLERADREAAAGGSS